MGLDAHPDHKLVEKVDANGNKYWEQVPYFKGENPPRKRRGPLFTGNKPQKAATESEPEEQDAG